MKVNGKHYRSIWFDGQEDQVKIIDQRLLPYEFKIISVESLEDFEVAIKDMAVRGAPLIGATAAFGVARQMLRDPSDASLESCFNRLIKTSSSPTGIVSSVNIGTKRRLRNNINVRTPRNDFKLSLVDFFVFFPRRARS